MEKTVIAAALLGAFASSPVLAQSSAWSTPQPPVYDSLCGEPENGECYQMPTTQAISNDGQFLVGLHCGNFMSLIDATGQSDALYTDVVLSVDGQPLGQFEIVGGLDTDYLNPAPTDAAIDALRRGNTLTMVLNQVTTSTVSLAGSSAAIAALQSLCDTDQSDGGGDQGATTGQREYFADYLATCRPDGGCDASTFSDTPTSDGNTFVSALTFNRAGGPGTAWIVSFAGAYEGPVAGTPIQVTIGQQTWTLKAGEGYGNIMSHNFFHWPANEEILAAMRTGSAMAISQTIQNGTTQTVTYSLRGLNDAIAWIDGNQGRTGEPALVGVPSGLEEIVPDYEPAQ